MSITPWLRHGVISSIIALLIIVAVFHLPSTVVRADTNLDIIPEGQGVRIRWQPDGESDNTELLFKVADGATPAFTIIDQTDALDSSRLPLVDDTSSSRDGASIGPVVRVRGQQYVVITLQPRVFASGNYRTITTLEAFIDQATYVASLDQLSHHEPFLADSQAPASYPASNFRIFVNKVGLQKLTADMLIAAGMPASGPHLSTLQLHYKNTDVPYHAVGLNDGVLDKSDFIAFYAPEPDDRWNPARTYWLSVAATAGTKMAVVSSSAASRPQGNGFEIQRMRTGSIYEPLVAGPDQDHWFMQRLRTDDINASDTTGPVTIQTRLKWSARATTSTTIRATVNGSVMEHTAGPHMLTLSVGTTQRMVQWDGIGDVSQTIVISNTRTAPPRLTLHTTGISEMLVDSVEFAQLATLISDVTFELPTAGVYQVSKKMPPDGIIYDITDPSQPVVRRHATNPDALESTAANQRVIFATSKAYQSPIVVAANPQAITVTSADALYITHPSLISAITPLVSYRQSQGIDAKVINVQDIYDGWSGGNVSPQAIRQFLTYVAHTWSHVPHTIILVGDGTVDPWNYSNSGAANVNLIPPYLADVDAYMGESSCESCFVRLDTADPLDDPAPDMSIGRLSVRLPTELTALVTKIIQYEGQSTAAWQQVHIMAADDKDEGGDFPYFAEHLGGHASVANLNTQTFAYDPNQDSDARLPLYSSAIGLRNDFLNRLNQGAGLLTYIGHSNHWQWAATDYRFPNPYFLYLWDVDQLKNTNRLPIVVGLSCLSSAFQRESVTGQTLDERLVSHPSAGAIAVWGSAGMEIATGHNLMFYRFYEALRDTTQPVHTIGAATFAGMTYLAASSNCCGSIVSAYTLIGDPLTKPRLAPSDVAFVPTSTPTSTNTATPLPSATPSRTPTPTLPGSAPKLAGWWPLDETANPATYSDTRGKSRFLCSTLPCATSKNDGVLANALAFTAAQAKSLDSSMNITLNRSWTMALWVRTTQAANQTLVSSVNKAPPFENVRLELGTTAGGKAFCGFAGATNSISSATINDGEWHLIVCSYNATTTTRTLYVDGTVQSSHVATFAGKSAKLRLGGRATGLLPAQTDQYSTADIDEFVVYTDALSAYDIQMLYNRFAPSGRALFPTVTRTPSRTPTASRTVTATTTPTLIGSGNRILGWWSFSGDTATTTWPDVSQKLAFQCGTPPCATSLANGLFQRGITFTASAQKTMDSTLQVPLNSTWSIGVWVRTSTANQVLVSSVKDAPYTDARVVIGIASDGKPYCNFSGVSNTKGTAVITDNNWHFLLCSYNPSTESRILYVDGIVQNATTAFFTGGTSKLRLGGRATSSTSSDLFSTADVDEFMVFASIPNSYEIKLLYNRFAPDGAILFPTYTPTVTRTK